MPTTRFLRFVLCAGLLAVVPLAGGDNAPIRSVTVGAPVAVASSLGVARHRSGEKRWGCPLERLDGGRRDSVLSLATRQLDHASPVGRRSGGPSDHRIEDEPMKRVPLLPLALSMLTGLATPSCQPSSDARGQGGRPATKSKKSLLAAAPGGSITVLAFPSDQDVYVVPYGHVVGGDTSRLTRQEYFAGRTPLQVAMPAVNYYVVVKQSPPGSYQPDGEWHDLYVFPDKADLTKTFTDAKVYFVSHSETKRSFVSSLVWPASMAVTDFMGSLPSEALLTVPDQDLERIKAVFRKNGVPEREWEQLFTLLRTTGRTAWQGPEYKSVNAYYCAFGTKGEAEELKFYPANLE